MVDLAQPPERVSRVVYLGSPSIAIPPLEALVETGFDVPLVITRPDARRGRGKGTSPNPVKLAAQDLGIQVSHDLAEVTEVKADLAVVVAYGKIIPTEILQQVAMINLHFSLLPRWRGAAPLERALINGDQETGVCLMAVEEGLDTGGVYDVEKISIDANWDLHQLGSKCVKVGAQMLVKNLSEGLGVANPQEGEATYASMLSAAEFEITRQSSAAEIIRRLKVRPCWMMLDGKRIKVFKASHSSTRASSELGELVGADLGLIDGPLRLETVQPEGKKQMPVEDWLQGRQKSSDHLD